jgi:hypothetical protein
MDQQEVLRKIAQVEEHARDAIAEYPNLALERLRMILAYARYLRAGLGGSLSDDKTDSSADDVPVGRLN